jgi:DNA replication protein DnaC
MLKMSPGASSTGVFQRYLSKYCYKLANSDLLILEDFGMRKRTAMEAQDLGETLEKRSTNKAPLFATH